MLQWWIFVYYVVFTCAIIFSLFWFNFILKCFKQPRKLCVYESMTVFNRIHASDYAYTCSHFFVRPLCTEFTFQFYIVVLANTFLKRKDVGCDTAVWPIPFFAFQNTLWMVKTVESKPVEERIWSISPQQSLQDCWEHNNKQGNTSSISRKLISTSTV